MFLAPRISTNTAGGTTIRRTAMFGCRTWLPTGLLTNQVDGCGKTTTGGPGVSYDPWGWAPYHYGRWFRGGYGWAWVPGPIYARYGYRPAVVGFFGYGGGGEFGLGFSNLGWVALGPFERYHPWYGRGVTGRGITTVNVVNNVNIYNTYRNARVPNGVMGVSAQQFQSQASRALRAPGRDSASKRRRGSGAVANHSGGQSPSLQRSHDECCCTEYDIAAICEPRWLRSGPASEFHAAAAVAATEPVTVAWWGSGLFVSQLAAVRHAVIWNFRARRRRSHRMVGASSVHLRRIRAANRRRPQRGTMLLRAALAVRSRLRHRLFSSAPVAAAGEHPSPLLPLEEGITTLGGAAAADIAASRSVI